MRLTHVLGFVAVLVVGYYLGMKYPSWGQSLGL